MTTVSTAPEETASELNQHVRRRYWTVLVTILVTALAALVVAIVTWTSAPSAQAAQLTRTANACRMWTATDPTAAPPAWCDDMITWMRQRLNDGAVGGMMMWSTPSAMRDTCREWASTSTGFDASLCDDMVDWMSQHVHNWSGWMMDGRGMMGSR